MRRGWWKRNGPKSLSGKEKILGEGGGSDISEGPPEKKEEDEAECPEKEGKLREVGG